MQNEMNKPKAAPLIDPHAPEPLRLACHLLALVQRDRCVSCAGDAAHVHTFAEACRDALAVVSNDRVMHERLATFAIDLCRRHGTLTRTQAREARRTPDSRRCAAMGAMRSMLDALAILDARTDEALHASGKGRTLN